MEVGASGVQASDGHHEDPILSTVGGMYHINRKMRSYQPARRDRADRQIVEYLTNSRFPSLRRQGPQLCQRRLRRERGVGYSYAVRLLWQVDGAPWLNPLRAFHSTVWWFARMTRERGRQEG